MIGGRAWTLALLCALPLAGCGGGSTAARAQCRGGQGHPASPAADRPVAAIGSPRWSNEQSRDRVNEAGDVMTLAGIKPGMTVADIGAGEGYYTIRLAARVGKNGRVLAEDIVQTVHDALAHRVARDGLDNVSVRLGLPADPRLPRAQLRPRVHDPHVSRDRIAL